MLIYFLYVDGLWVWLVVVGCLLVVLWVGLNCLLICDGWDSFVM